MGAGEHRHLRPRPRCRPGGAGPGPPRPPPRGRWRRTRTVGAGPGRLVGPQPVGGVLVAGGGGRAVEDGVGHGQDLGRRAVVVVEVHDRGRREAVPEAGEVAGVGAVPGVDRLVGVADHAQVGAVAPPRLEQAELEGVDVLELVDEQVPEAPALGGAERAVVLQGVGAQDQQVVEVDQAGAWPSRARSARRGRPWPTPAPAGGGRRRWRRPRSRRATPSGLGPLDLGGDVGRGTAGPGPAGGRSGPGAATLRSSRAGGRSPRSAHSRRSWP